MTDQPGLFDRPPARQAQPGPPRPGRRGRRRETWTRTVVAHLHVDNEQALLDAASHQLTTGTVTVIGEEEGDSGRTDPAEHTAISSAAAVELCLDPTAGLWPLLEGPLRITGISLAATDEGPGRVRVTWAVTVKIIDAGAVRERALNSCTSDAHRAEIETDFGAAWNHAADPYAPLTTVPGMTSTSVTVNAEHLRQRPPT